MRLYGWYVIRGSNRPDGFYWKDTDGHGYWHHSGTEAPADAGRARPWAEYVRDYPQFRWVTACPKRRRPCAT